MKSKMKRATISKAIRIYIVLTMISYKKTEMATGKIHGYIDLDCIQIS